MNKTVVLNVVGLSQGVLGNNTPRLNQWLADKALLSVRPQVPAVTCTMQATYLTGTPPSTHGIVGNGWYFKDECEVKFWRQSNKLVEAPKIWEQAKKIDPNFTCANMFWWYNMYSSVDYSVTPRPNYLADGRKIPDVYSHPAGLRDQLQQELGQFPLFEFWGPNTTINSSKWIAEASKQVEMRHNPTLTLIYLPHLDYALQKYNFEDTRTQKDIQQIDVLVGDLIDFYEQREARVVLLSEYGITAVTKSVALNRVLREAGYLAIRNEQSWELLDAGASKAFAVADHQIAHIYVKDAQDISAVRTLIESQAGVAAVWDKQEQQLHGLDHERSGDLVVLADSNAWFNYYYWLDDDKAPDFARTVDIHRKPGYDPVEMFADPNIKMLKPLIGWKLLKKKLGFRTLMDVIALEPELISGSHGVVPEDQKDWALLARASAETRSTITATDVYQEIWNSLTT